MALGTRLFTTGLALGTALVAAPAPAQQPDLARARQLLAEARAVAEKMFDRGPRMGLVGEVAGAQARAGDRQAALATAAASQSFGWKAAAKGFAEAGDVDAALDAASRIVDDSMASQFLGLKLERDDTLKEVAFRCAQRRDVKGAQRAIRGIGIPAMAASAYARMAEAQARAGDAPEARRTFGLAESAVGQAQPSHFGPGWQMQGYGEIGKAHARLGSRAAAIAALDRGLAAARRAPDELRDGTIAAHAADRAEAGDFDGALRALKEVRSPGRRESAPEVAKIARSLAEAGQHDRAMQTAALAAADPYANAFAALGAVYLRKGDTARAAQAFERAISGAEQQSNAPMLEFSFRDSALLEVAQAQAQAGDRDGALRTAARIVRRGPNAETYINDAVYGALALGQAEAGSSEAALRTVALIKAYPPPREMWRALGRTEGRRGNVDPVLARGPAESDESRRTWLLIGLAEGLVARAEGRP